MEPLYSLNQISVLLIEDDPRIQTIHMAFLRKMRLQVDTAMTGSEALMKFKKYPYPLVLLDGGLPDMYGNELGKRLREIEKNEGRARVPFILLSAYSEDQVRKWCNEADIDACAIKLVHPDRLKELIQKYFKRLLEV